MKDADSFGRESSCSIPPMSSLHEYEHISSEDTDSLMKQGRRLSMDARVFKNNLDARYAETDKSGIVSMHHYLTWLDLARDGFFAHMGIPYICSFEACGYMLMLTDYQISFNRCVYFGETVDLYSMITRLESKRLYITHTIYLKGEDPDRTLPVCEAVAKLAFVSMETHRSVSYDEANPEIFEILRSFMVDGY